MRLIDRNAHTNRWRGVAAGEKVLAALGLMAVALASGSWVVEAGILVIAAGATVLGARVPLADLAKSAGVPLGFIATGCLAQMLTLDFARAFPIALSVNSVEPALFVALRAMACVSALLFLALTTPLTDIIRLLRRLGLGREMCDIILVMFRFVWLTLDCLEAGVRSQANRLGYAGYRRSLHSSGLLLAGLLPRTLSRAERLEAGLAARGYDGDLVFISREQPLNTWRLVLIGASLASLAIFSAVAG